MGVIDTQGQIFHGSEAIVKWANRQTDAQSDKQFMTQKVGYKDRKAVFCSEWFIPKNLENLP